MLTAEEKQELTRRRESLECSIAEGSGGDRWPAKDVKRLIELERKDIDPSAGPPFSRGLPSIEERLAHHGPWESWESPNDRCLVWFSPDGHGYDVDYGHGEERKFHPVTAANWGDTWLRRMPAPEKTQCPGCNMCSKTCGSCENLCPDGTRCQACGQIMHEGAICDGSGVIARPAPDFDDAPTKERKR